MESENFDQIGYWSEVKLDIVRDYAKEYSKILTANNFFHIYIDAFSGRGIHLSKSTGDYVLGSPLNALLVEPPFNEYHFIDLDSKKAHALSELIEGNPAAKVYDGDCNVILLNDVFPRAKFGDFKRALCLLDPYGLHLKWEVILAAGQMESIEIFLNFPIADMNRNVLRLNPEEVDQTQIDRMNSYWGDESWRSAAYDTSMNLFGFEEKTSNEKVAEAFRQRLVDVAGFKFVPKPIPMRNTRNAVVYYLYFASQKPVAKRIVDHIFDKYRSRREA